MRIDYRLESDAKHSNFRAICFGSEGKIGDQQNRSTVWRMNFANDLMQSLIDYDLDLL